MYRIGDFSKLTKTTIKTLRYYDEVGLLKPEYVDEENGYRYYTTSQLFSLHKIISLRQLGLSVNDTLNVMSGNNVENILQNRKAEILSFLNEAQTQLSRINYILSDNEEDLFMNYQAVIKDLPECIVYSKRMKLNGYQDYFKVIPTLGETIMKANPDLKCVTPEYCFIISHDGEYKEKDIDVEFCEAVDKFGKEVDGIVFKKLEGVKAATVFHKGSYEGLRQAYAFIMNWIEENGYKMADNPRENYIDGIWNKDNEEDWLTEIQVPIK
jgi:DNA-binding transcriptional MerR regulator